MEFVESVRYWLGVVTLVTWVPAILTWVFIHPLIKFWRKTGPVIMWVVVGPLNISAIAGLFVFRNELLGADLGSKIWALVPGLLLTLAGFYLDFERRKTLTTRILVGTPEIKGESSNLLTTGPYSRVRHPRYLAIFLSYFGFVFLANFLGLYIYLVVSLPLLFLIIYLEEKELKERFGKAYEEYAKQTPMLFPKKF